MRYLVVLVLFVCMGCNKHASKVFLQESSVALSMPLINIDDVFFDTRTLIRVEKLDEGIEVRYTTNGNEPTENSSLYKDVIKVAETTEYKFKAFRNGMVPSETAEINAFETRKVNWIGMKSTDPNENYNSGIDVLHDKIKGDFNFRSDDWFGYQDSIVEYSITLEEGEEINGVVVSTIVDQKSWIFSPEHVLVTYEFADGTKLNQKVTVSESRAQSDRHMNFIKITTEPSTPIKIDIKVHNLISIPEWHPGKGLRPWLFVDEILML